MDERADADLASLYGETRERVVTLVAGLTSAELSTRMPACPAWTVRDVVGHLAAIPEDAVAGKLKGIPTDEVTDGQVARMAGLPVADVLARWAAVSPDFEKTIAAHQVWPAVIDVASHEQDVRSALGRPGARDCAAVRACTPRLLDWLELPVRLRIRTEDGEHRAGPESAGLPEMRLTTSRFEAFRWRMGRRSRAQLAAMDWSADPAPVLDYLAVFGPAERDVIE
ncbi:MAG: maleylpyruvate isomerase family mycothiol-dependent enzyme [Streptosporangiaceae bacterium]